MCLVIFKCRNGVGRGGKGFEEERANFAKMVIALAEGINPHERKKAGQRQKENDTPESGLHVFPSQIHVQ